MNQLEHRYRVMFDNMAQGAFYQMADGSLADVNSAALTMFGLTREEFMGRTSTSGEWRVITEDGSELSPRQHPSMVALFTGKPVRDFIAGIYNPQQQCFIWLNINAIPMFKEGETTPYQVFVTLHDVSQQQRMNDIHLSRIHLMQFAHSHPLEELLVEALDELERLTGSAIGFYHFFDEQSRSVTLKEWSTRTATRFCKPNRGGHYSIDQAGVWVDCIVKGEAVIHNDYATLPHRRGLPEGHVPVTRELVVPVKRNGRIVAVMGVGNKGVDYTEADVHTVSLFADLTWDIAERKQAELLLLQASRQHEILTNTAMDGYWVVDAQGRILFANETCCRMRGYGLEEMLTKKVRDFDAVEDEAELADHFTLIRERGYDRFETRHHHKDGRIIDVEISAAFIPESGQILAFTRDITAQKQMQDDLLRSKADLKQANELLEHRVSQRTADLQAAIREQESFSYSVSHDLRAPLRHINSFSAMLQEDYGSCLPVTACDYLDRIRAASSRMGALIDHLLELSRVTRSEITLGNIDLSQLAVATLRMLEETEPHRQVEQRIEAGLQAVGDQHLLSQLLSNLLGNAWKYSSRKSSACIEFGKTRVSGHEAYFIRDNGAGFDMTYKKKLFKAFERLHGSEFEGIGIGLATAQRIIQRHGGKIWADGEVDRGATFYFTLPGRRAEARPAKLQSCKAAVPQA